MTNREMAESYLAQAGEILAKFPEAFRKEIDRLASISRRLRREEEKRHRQGPSDLHAGALRKSHLWIRGWIFEQLVGSVGDGCAIPGEGTASCRGGLYALP